MGFIFTVFLMLSACSMQKVESQKTQFETERKTEDRKSETENQTKNYVLVELFTSEGCSSCPAADQVLARLQKEQPVENVEIVPLALHVDYWNYLGWKDKFSSAEYSARQTGYAEKFKIDSIYTPQMVVDGRQQFVGSQFDTAIGSIKEFSQIKKADVKLSVETSGVKIEISDLPTHDTAYVWFVLTEDDLQTDVGRGENSGRKLLHTAVAREMKMINTIAENDKDFSATQAFTIQPDWQKEKLNFIVFIQGKDSKTIFAVGKKHLV